MDLSTLGKPQTSNSQHTVEYSQQRTTDRIVQDESGYRSNTVSYRDKVSISYASKPESAQIYSANGTVVDAVQDVEQPKTPAGSNILDFVGGRVRAEAEGGANAEVLFSLLNDGLSGFREGFFEAFDILAGSGMLIAEVRETIGQTYEQVINGVDALALELGIESPVTDDMRAELQARMVDAPVNQPENITTTSIQNLFAGVSANPVNNDSTDIDRKNSHDLSIIKDLQASLVEQQKVLTEAAKLRAQDMTNGKVVSSERASYQANNFTFELTTRDGDKVSVSISHEQARSLSISIDDVSVSGEYAAESRFQLNIDGELDEEELSAINNLLADIRNISEAFFSGDINDAFEQALAIGFDSDEIAGFALNLTKQTVTYAEKTYSAIEDYAPKRNQQLSDSRSLLGMPEEMRLMKELIKTLREGIQEARKVGGNGNNLGELAKFIAQPEHPNEQGLNHLASFIDSISSLS